MHNFHIGQFDSVLKNAKKASQELDNARKIYDEACNAERAYLRVNLHLDFSSCPKDFANKIKKTREKLNEAIAVYRQAYNELLDFLSHCKGHIIKLDLQGLNAEQKQLEEIFSAIDGNNNLVVSAINIASSACDEDYIQTGLSMKGRSEEKFESRKYVITGFDKLEIVGSTISVSRAGLDKDQQQWLKNKIRNLHNEALFFPEEISSLSLDKKIELTSCIGLFKRKTTLRTYLVDRVSKDITTAAALYNALTTSAAQPQLLSILKSDATGRKIYGEWLEKPYKSDLEIPLLNSCTT